MTRPHVLVLTAGADRGRAEAWADTAERAAGAVVADWAGSDRVPKRFLVYAAGDESGFQATYPSDRPAQAPGWQCRQLPRGRTRTSDCAGAVPGTPRVALNGAVPEYTGKGDQVDNGRSVFGHALLAPLCEQVCNGSSWARAGYTIGLAWHLTDDPGSYGGIANALANSSAFDGRLPRSDAMWSADAKTLEAAQWAAVLAVRFIADEYGQDKAHQFVTAAFTGRDDGVVDAALRDATGLTRAAFEKQWAAWVRSAAS